MRINLLAGRGTIYSLFVLIVPLNASKPTLISKCPASESKALSLVEKIVLGHSLNTALLIAVIYTVLLGLSIMPSHVGFHMVMPFLPKCLFIFVFRVKLKSR